MTISRSAAGGDPRVTADSLQRLAPVDLRELVISLLRRRGHTLKAVRPGADHEDLIVGIEPILGPRAGLVRIGIGSRSVASEVAEAAAAYGCSDWVLITAGTGEAHPNILTFDRLASLLESEPVIARDSTGAAVLDAQLYDRLSQVGHEIDAHDPSGIKWLPALARNQLPPALARLRTPASALFERYGLRVFTTCLLLGGRRLGASRPGQAEPDALIWDSRGRLALIDFKAAREGWGMERDDLRALMEYGARRYDVPNGHPRVPDAVVVVSSRFKAADAARARRAAEFEARGQRLVHLSADDLVSVALHARDLGDRDTSSLTSADWEPVTRHHTPTVDVLLSVLREQ